MTEHCPLCGWTPDAKRYPDLARAVAIHRVSECLGPACHADVSVETPDPIAPPHPVSMAARMRYALSPYLPGRRRRKVRRIA